MKLQFKCQQCGECCTKYGTFLTASAQDIVRWRKEGREDILSKMRVFESGDVIMGGDLWFNPRTGRKMAKCPFLRKSRGKSLCSIHSTKPGVCRKYPFTGVDVRLECKGIKIL